MENKLDPEFKAKWVAALRSGNYNQAQYELYSEEKKGYCCIGVGGSIQGMSDAQLKGQSQATDSIYKMCVPGLSEKKRAILIGMNDSDNRTFSEIADYIESNL